ncbi:IS4 family transposase [Neomoorella thermoacetica]|uniref:IS4 family transposase n=1 Tax=Neomoorella thermoacetica TaxID=1525 RepID=UPI0030D605CE
MKLIRLTENFITWFDNIRKSQRKTLATLVFGLMKSRRTGIAAIARGIPGPVAKKHKIKLVDRFLGNEGIVIEKVVQPLINWLTAGRKRLLVAIDWTDLHDGKHQALFASAVLGTRAVPLLWRVVEKTNPQLSQNQEEERLLENLKKLIPKSTEVIILADRGFGRVELLKKLELLGFKYIIRVSRTVWVNCEQFTGILQDLPAPRGQIIDFSRVIYHKKEQHQIRLIYQFDAEQEEPWFLVTQLDWQPKKVASAYGRRMDIEESFKDFKNPRTGFGLRGLRLSTAFRYERLFLIMTYAYFFLLLAGIYGEQKDYHRKLVSSSTKKRRVLGLWQVGYYVLEAFRISWRRLLDYIPALMPVI